jgi:hypothetical protein
MLSEKRQLLLAAFAPAVIGNIRLARLPELAAANGVGQGIPWTSSIFALGFSALTLIVASIVAWKFAELYPRTIGILPALAAFISFLGRRIAAYGAPEEFYLVDDFKLWIVLLAVAFLLGILVAATPRRTAGLAANEHRSKR